MADLKECPVCGSSYDVAVFKQGRRYIARRGSSPWQASKSCRRKQCRSAVVDRPTRKVVCSEWMPTPAEIEAARSEIDKANGYAPREIGDAA
jgi:hypothetical protein